MQNMWIANVVALIVSMPLSADSWGGADCVLIGRARSEAQSAKESVAAFRHQDSWALTKLDFVPSRVFLAHGSAIKLFPAENFNGEGRFVTNDEWPAEEAPGGGAYVATDKLGLSGVKSFACVDAGAHLPEGAHLRHMHFFNDQIFTLSGYRGHRPRQVQVRVEFRGGSMRMVAFDLSWDGFGDLFTMDLATGSISMTHKTPDGEWTRELVPMGNRTPDQRMMYVGAAHLMSEVVSTVYHNKQNSGGGERLPVVPHLELEKALGTVTAAARSL